jgi:hypothetical protein
MKYIKDSYNIYKENNGKLKKKEFTKINYMYMEFLINKVTSGSLVHFPAKTGTLCVAGSKMRIKRGDDGKIMGMSIDWKNTLKYWKENPKAKESKKMLYFTNEHTDGYRYKYRWSKVNINALNKFLYRFVAARANKRVIWRNILNGAEYRIKNKIYIE